MRDLRLAHGILDAQLVHLLRVEAIEVDAMHEIHETIGGIIFGEIVDLLKERYKHARKFQIKTFHTLCKRIRLIQSGLRLYTER